MKKLVAGVALATLAVLVIATAAVATLGAGTSTTALGQGSLAPLDVKVKTGAWKLSLDTKGPSDISVSEIRVTPGGHFGWHSHPGPSLVIVKSGTSTFYRGDDPTCTGEEHPAGTAYVDPGGVVHTARNEGTVDLVIVVTRFAPAGAAPRIDQPDPGNCNF